MSRRATSHRAEARAIGMARMMMARRTEAPWVDVKLRAAQ